MESVKFIVLFSYIILISTEDYIYIKISVIFHRYLNLPYTVILFYAIIFIFVTIPIKCSQ